MATSCFSNFSVLVQVNSGMLDMWCNWWTHYKKLKLENPVYVVAHGDDAIAALVNEYGLPPERLLAPPRMGAAEKAVSLSAQRRCETLAARHSTPSTLQRSVQHAI